MMRSVKLWPYTYTYYGKKVQSFLDHCTVQNHIFFSSARALDYLTTLPPRQERNSRERRESNSEILNEFVKDLSKAKIIFFNTTTE